VPFITPSTPELREVIIKLMIVPLELSSENAHIAMKLIGGFGPAPSEQVSKPHTPSQPDALLISSEKTERTNSLLYHKVTLLCHH